MGFAVTCWRFYIHTTYFFAILLYENPELCYNGTVLLQPKTSSFQSHTKIFLTRLCLLFMYISKRHREPDGQKIAPRVEGYSYTLKPNNIPVKRMTGKEFSMPRTLTPVRRAESATQMAKKWMSTFYGALYNDCITKRKFEKMGHTQTCQKLANSENT